MSYITRADGERFVIPSYRDTLNIQKTSLLKKEVQLLSKSYGEYVALQRKGINQYEVAFSPEPGVLLGETVWEHFKRPNDLIYCELMPDPLEAILVIVKSGSVYLEGRFHTDSIAEELFVLKTLNNKFDVYVQGDVPISQVPIDGKFLLDASSVNTFTVLDKPVFPVFLISKSLQLQSVDAALRKYGIGALPVKKMVIVIAILGGVWAIWSFMPAYKPEPIQQVVVVNPYQAYLDQLNSPGPYDQVMAVSKTLSLLLAMPGWYVESVSYDSSSQLDASVKSLGATTEALFAWAAKNNFKVVIGADGFHLKTSLFLPVRSSSSKIAPINVVVGKLSDQLKTVLLGNVLSIKQLVSRGAFSELGLEVSFQKVSPTLLCLIGKQFENSALVLSKMNVTVENGSLTGSITLTALGT